MQEQKKPRRNLLNKPRRNFLQTLVLTPLSLLFGNQMCALSTSRTVADVTIERMAITEEFWASLCARKVTGLGEYTSVNLVYFHNGMQEQLPAEEAEVVEGDIIEWRDIATEEIIVEGFTVPPPPC